MVWQMPSWLMTAYITFPLVSPRTALSWSVAPHHSTYHGIMVYYGTYYFTKKRDDNKNASSRRVRERELETLLI